MKKQQIKDKGIAPIDKNYGYIPTYLCGGEEYNMVVYIGPVKGIPVEEAINKPGTFSVKNGKAYKL